MTPHTVAAAGGLRTLLDLDGFHARHLGPTLAHEAEMLALLGRRSRESEVYSFDRLAEAGDFLDTLRHYCAVQDIPAKGAVSEFAPGQFEVNLRHVDDPVTAADHALLFNAAALITDIAALENVRILRDKELLLRGNDAAQAPAAAVAPRTQEKVAVKQGGARQDDKPSLLGRISRGLKSLVTRGPSNQH